MKKAMTWLLVLAAALFALLLFCTHVSYVEGFAAALLPSDPSPPAVLPSDPPINPPVDARCRNYGFSMTNIQGQDNTKRYYTESGCQGLGGTWDNSKFTCFTDTIDYSSMCAGLPYTTPAPDECFPNGDRTQILGKPNPMVGNKPETTGLYRVHTQEECQRLGGVASAIPELPGSYLCMKGTTPLYMACRSLNYREPACKSYGVSLPPIIAGKYPQRLYTKSGCDGVGGTLNSAGVCVKADGGSWNMSCASLDNTTPAPDECFPNGDRTKILGVPSPYIAKMGLLWTGNMRLYTPEECNQLGGALDGIEDGPPGLYKCTVNNKNTNNTNNPLHLLCASLNNKPAAPTATATSTMATTATTAPLSPTIATSTMAATTATTAPLNPTIAAALGPGTPASSCPAPQPCLPACLPPAPLLRPSVLSLPLPAPLPCTCLPAPS